MHGDPSVRDEPLYATRPPEGLPGVPEGALIRLDREEYGLVSGMSGWRSRIVSRLKEEGYEMNVYEPCLFSKFAVREEPAVDGGSIAPVVFVGCVLLEVDDFLMGGPWKAHHESMDRLRQRIKFGEVAPVVTGRAVLLRRASLHTVTGSKLQGRHDEDSSERDYDQFRYHVGDAWTGVMKRPMGK